FDLNIYNVGQEYEGITYEIDWGDGSPTEFYQGYDPANPVPMPNPGYVYNQDGIYTVTVTATDDDGDTFVQTQEIIVEALLPNFELDVYNGFDYSNLLVEDQWFDLNIYNMGQEYEGITYEIDWGDGSPTEFYQGYDPVNPVPMPNPGYVYNQDGIYTVTVTATDDDGDTFVQTQEIIVEASNIAPTDLQFGLDKASYKQGETLAITNGQVFDENGIADLQKVDLWLEKADRTWEDISDVTSFNPNGGFGYSLDLTDFAVGSYTLWARAYDQKGAFSNSFEQSFEVTAANTAPTGLQFGVNKPSYEAGEMLSLTGAQVTDAEGNLERVDFWLKTADGSWEDISDATSFSPDGGFSFDLDLTDFAAGNYTLWARAYDQEGATSNSVQKAFEVTAVNVNSAPTDLQFGFDKPSYKAGETLSLTGAQVTDVDNNLDRVDFWLKTANGAWENIDDVVNLDFNTDGSFDYSVDLTGYAQGTYTLWAKAYDQAGASSNVTQQTFEVTAANAAPTNLQFEVAQPSYNSGETLMLSNAQVLDVDGAGDINKVDFWLKGPNNQWLNLPDAEAFTAATDNSNLAEFEYDLLITGGLTGTYTLWARTYDQAGANSNSLKKTFDVQAGTTPSDILTGGAGVENTFALGDISGALYGVSGVDDYALINNFVMGEDIIQLYGDASDYRLGAALEGTAIYRTVGPQEELLGVVTDVSSLSLGSDAFSFVPAL
ncbi:MAG: hypothetical protein AAFV72_12075, partial [Cyanobacteria bacterium J06635_1]